MLKEHAKQFYNKLYSMPPAPADLEEFGKQVIAKFVEELINNSQGVAWTCGLDSVVFLDKNIEGKKSLKQIKEDYLGQECDVSDSDES